MSKCIQCGDDKPADDFYAHPMMAAGHVNVCKECHKARMRIRARTSPAVQEYDRQRAKRPERLAKSAENAKRWNVTNPQGMKAHGAVHRAVRAGKLKRLPCEFCGTERVHAHHRDYSKPLDVVWLCAKCHHRLHALFPETEGKMKTMSS